MKPYKNPRTQAPATKLDSKGGRGGGGEGEGKEGKEEGEERRKRTNLIRFVQLVKVGGVCVGNLQLVLASLSWQAKVCQQIFKCRVVGLHLLQETTTPVKIV